MMPKALDKSLLSAMIDRLANVPVLVIGDVMLDHYLSGDAERISPEAPVPVVRVDKERHLLGGAGNVARNIAALGGDPEIISVIGADDPGKVLQDLLAKEGLRGNLVVEKSRMTTIKTRIIARNQQMIRVDREEVRQLQGQSLEALESIVRKVSRQHTVIVLSDYGKGVVCKALLDTIHELKTSSDKPIVVLVDPKVINAGLYAGMDVLTPNAKEAGEITGIQAKGKDAVIKAGHALFKQLRCSHVCITLGADGMAVFEKPGKVYHVPTVARSVFDVTGAGDTVISVLALALGAGLSLVEASVLANYAAGIVVGQVGTAAATPESLQEAVRKISLPKIESWLNIE
jgi:rfaE bifunctional protein kinase chain/domain